MEKFRKAALAAVVVLSALAAGCSSVEGAYRTEGRVSAASGFQFDDVSVEESFARTSQLHFPSRILVAGLESNLYGRFGDPGTEELVAALGEDAALWSEAAPLPWFLITGQANDVAVLRRAAARTQADLLLLYEQRVRMDQDHNALYPLNLLVLPALLVPTVTYEVAVSSTAAVVDVRNGIVYATASDERTGQGASASAWVADGARDLKRSLMADALEALRTDLRTRLLRR